MASTRDGIEMPMIGLGTRNLQEEEVEIAINTALDTGYRHIDTAHLYDNEVLIGNALKNYFKSGKLSRKDVFITTKLWVTNLAKKDVKPALIESLKRLQLDYLDLYLIHAPFGIKNIGDGTLAPKDENDQLILENYNIVETWHALEKLVNEGKTRFIGVSNFNSVQIERICQNAKKIKPYTNQVECHIYLHHKKLQKFCLERNIFLTGFAPFGSPGKVHTYFEGCDTDLEVLRNDTLKTVGKKYNKTAAQIMLRNLIQRGIRVIPKSSNPDRIKENFNVFDFHLSPEDMASIGEEKVVLRYFTFAKSTPNVAKHPEYPFNIPY